MKNLIIILVISIILFPACHKCSDSKLTHYGYLPQMENYFGMYKNGNWWKYKNQDFTKTDSVYITNFKEVIKRESQVGCCDYPYREITVNSQFMLTGTTSLPGVYNTDGCTYVNYISFLCSATMNGNYDTRPKGTHIPEVFYDSIIVSNVKYRNVIYFKSASANVNGTYDTLKTFFAPSIGIIRFINHTDTLSLTTYHIQ